MNCLYCHQDCSITHTDHKISTANCLSCYVAFSFFDGNGAEITVITWSHIFVDGKKYIVKIYPGRTGNAPEFIVFYSKDVSRFQETLEWHDIIRFDFIPDWTPQNIKEKIKSLRVYL
jgi:hypothetical protein